MIYQKTNKCLKQEEAHHFLTFLVTVSTVTVNLQYNGFSRNGIIFSLWNDDAIA